MSETYADTNASDVTALNSSNIKRKNESGNENQESEDPRPKIKYNPDSLYYDMTGEKLMVIFNHSEYNATPFYNYKSPAPRAGTEEDVKKLKLVFGDFGFKVAAYHNKTRDEIWDICENLSKVDHSDTSCLCVVFLTHGEKNNELFAYDQSYNLQPIIRMFEGLPTLVTKPKLFFIQACRGSKLDDGTTVTIDGPAADTTLVPSHADFFFMRSTVDDYRSFRDKYGSWMIQELCAVMKEYGDKFDLLQIATLVHQRVAVDRISYSIKMPAISDKKQMPETTFTLTKLLRFK